MSIIPSELKRFVEENPKLVTRRESKRYPGLFVLKYGREVFYKNLWHLNPLLLECRGLVVDADYRVVIKPFTKVFNYGENDTTIARDEVCTWVRKVNGFLGVVTYDPKVSDDLIYSTTGSLDSDFVDLIAKHVDPLKDRIMGDVVGRAAKLKTTLMFEICDETDPHIIPEEFGAWLIGADFYYDSLYKDEEKSEPLPEPSLNILAGLIGAKRPESGVARFTDIKRLANDCKHEGYMVYGHVSGTALKIKSPYYLLTKFLARAGERKLAECLSGPREKVLEKFSEEYYPLIDYIRSISCMFEGMTEQGRIELIRDFLNKNNDRNEQ